MPRSIKIVGISGAGKTTLIKRFLEKNTGYDSMSFGDFLARHRNQADAEWEKCLLQSTSVILIDDHLEWGERDFISLYKAEGTMAILLIWVTPQRLMERRQRDATRIRSTEVDLIEREQLITQNRARLIASTLNISLRETIDATIEENIAALNALIEKQRSKKMSPL
jgi:adenylate kinase